jgi:hypothetical protein
LRPGLVARPIPLTGTAETVPAIGAAGKQANRERIRTVLLALADGGYRVTAAPRTAWDTSRVTGTARGLARRCNLEAEIARSLREILDADFGIYRHGRSAPLPD